MSFRRTAATGVVALVLIGTATACGSSSVDAKIPANVRIGIKFDQPGLGLKSPDGQYTGFDVDVARYVAQQLGYKEKDITWVNAPSAQRDKLITEGQVDFVVASYSITDARRKMVSFVGPYFVAHQDLLVRAKDKSITGVEDLNGKNLCSVTGSTSAENMKDGFAPKAHLRTFASYSECITGLGNGSVDAVTTDDSILAGFAAETEHRGKFKLVGLELSVENYGIGMQKGNAELHRKVRRALEKMITNGAWENSVEKNFGPAHYNNDPAPVIDETD